MFLNLLDKHEKRQLLFTTFLVLSSSILELINLIVIGLFISFVSTSKNNILNKHLEKLFDYFDLADTNQKLLFILLLVIFILILSTFFQYFSNKYRIYFINNLRNDISNKILSYLLNLELLEFRKYSLQDINSIIFFQTERFCNKLINSILVSIGAFINILLGISLAFYLFGLNVIFFFLIIFIFYYLSYLLFKRRLSHNDTRISIVHKLRVKLTNDISRNFNLIKIEKLYDHFIRNFKNLGNEFKYLRSFNELYPLVVKPVFEFIAILSFVVIIFIQITIFEVSSDELIFFIGVFALMIYRLGPNLNNVYKSISTIKANYSSYLEITEYLKIYKKVNKKKIKLKTFPKILEFKNINFGYNNDLLIKNLDIKLFSNKINFIVGPSGTGKTTLTNIISLLIQCSNFELLINNKLYPLNRENQLRFQNDISIMSNDNYLFEGTMIENINLTAEIKIKNNNELIKKLKIFFKDNEIEIFKKQNFYIFENGNNLSSGQKQRFIFLRILLSNKKILIFDEPTSALDKDNADLVTSTIESLMNKKLIIVISHKQNILKEKNNNIIKLS